MASYEPKKPPAPSAGPLDEVTREDAEVRDWDWSVLPEGSVSSRFAAPSGSLAMATMGKPGNTRVVLVPGVTGSKEDFAIMMPDLAEAGFQVVSYDLAGQYESAGAGPENLVPPRKHYDYELFVDDFLAVLESGEGPAHVVGYSFAGIVAQIAYTRRPELFRSLTLLSCPPEPGQGFRGVTKFGRVTGWANGRVGAALMIWGIRRNFNKITPHRLTFVRHRFRFTRRQSVRDIYELMKRAPDLRQELAAATLPKFVAVGEHDLWPLELHQRFARSIGARIAVYRGGHSPCETSPHEFARDLLALYAGSG
ncbi:alpha/beta fold hydrolase [Arthrobacter sp. HMWF013]|uniref:alpha/beta fold hydrolase n=1 Tax=Arthrobacter sp. HMWF013 TaxID=2056849 RepID=UPI000D369236|nr:alpha/beta hydrolase [Arthrobacter sp. HMWF013]PTT69610.1 alpha/beta hydrolase [Arthrobacter sp. HMWF013]